MGYRWSRESIALEILSMYESGENLNYSAVADNNLTLLRAATRYFGTWEAAVRFAGIDYDNIRKYRSWTRERIVSRIRELHEQGTDLSWRNVCINIDPQLAAAATKKSHFGSWREALEASGLDYDTIRRYKEWDDDRVLDLVKELYSQGKDMNAKNVEHEDITLITAARRRFDTWHQTLIAAGLDYRQIVQRAPFRRGLGRGQAKSGVLKLKLDGIPEGMPKIKAEPKIKAKTGPKPKSSAKSKVKSKKEGSTMTLDLE